MQPQPNLQHHPTRHYDRPPDGQQPPRADKLGQRPTCCETRTAAPTARRSPTTAIRRASQPAQNKALSTEGLGLHRTQRTPGDGAQQERRSRGSPEAGSRDAYQQQTPSTHYRTEYQPPRPERGRDICAQQAPAHPTHCPTTHCPQQHTTGYGLCWCTGSGHMPGACACPHSRVRLCDRLLTRAFLLMSRNVREQSSTVRWGAVVDCSSGGDSPCTVKHRRAYHPDRP